MDEMNLVYITDEVPDTEKWKRPIERLIPKIREIDHKQKWWWCKTCKFWIHISAWVSLATNCPAHIWPQLACPAGPPNQSSHSSLIKIHTKPHMILNQRPSFHTKILILTPLPTYPPLIIISKYNLKSTSSHPWQNHITHNVHNHHIVYLPISCKRAPYSTVSDVNGKWKNDMPFKLL